MCSIMTYLVVTLAQRFLSLLATAFCTSRIWLVARRGNQPPRVVEDSEAPPCNTKGTLFVGGVTEESDGNAALGAWPIHSIAAVSSAAKRAYYSSAECTKSSSRTTS